VPGTAAHDADRAAEAWLAVLSLHGDQEDPDPDGEIEEGTGWSGGADPPAGDDEEEDRRARP
jgi:hypothetical protein